MEGLAGDGHILEGARYNFLVNLWLFKNFSTLFLATYVFIGGLLRSILGKSHSVH